MFLNNQLVTEKIEREIKKFSRNQWQWKGQLKTYGMHKSSSKSKVYSNTILPQETRKKSNRQPNFTPKITGKRRRRRTTTTTTKQQKKLVEGKKS